MVFKVSYSKHQLENLAWENTQVNEVYYVKLRILTDFSDASHAKLDLDCKDDGTAPVSTGVWIEISNHLNV